MKKHMLTPLRDLTTGSAIIAALFFAACGGGEQENSTTNNMSSTGNNAAMENMMPGNMEPGNMMPGNMEPGNMEPGNMMPGNMMPGNMEPGNMEPGNMMPGNSVSGKASMTFKATFGSNFGNQLPSSWRAPLALSSDGDGPLVVMLCEEADATCEAPVKVVEVMTDKPVQGSFGPDITVTDLPEGDFNVMVFLDSERSRTRGFSWEETPAKTKEKAWGGYVSEFDIMMSAPDESPSADLNPAPAPVKVTLAADAPAELGTIRMAHFHERRIDPVPVPEAGVIAVVTETGLRIIDLETFEVADAGAGFRDYFLTDAQGNDLSNKGSICGMIQAEEAVIYVLYAGGDGAGFAVPFDVSTRQQLGDGHVVKFPGSGSPCQGIYHKTDAGEYLYAINIGASGIAQGDSGMWYANLSGGFGEDIDGVALTKNDDDLYEVGFNAIAAHGDKLYATATPQDEDSTHVPADTVGQHTIFIADIQENGALSFKSGEDYTYWTPMPSRDGVVAATGNVDCVTPDRNGGSFAGMYKAEFHDGRPLLFLGGCSNIAVFDLDAGEQVDVSPANPRTKTIDATLFGHGYTRFALSPDKDVLYVLPQYKSQFHFYFAKDNDDTSRQTFNRYMILPLALDQGDAPALHPDFAGENIDNHEGGTNIGDKVTPAEDPGIDINAGHLTRYQVNWSGSLAGSTNQSGSIPTGPSIAAGRNTIWLRGSGVPGNSGLAKGSNLMTYSVKERRAHLWGHNQNGRMWDWYHVWQAGNETDAPFGYDLTPENDGYLATYGLLYVDTK